MSTVAAAETAVRVRPARETFYVGMAGACLLVGLLGFTPTYWAPMATGTLGVSPLTHVHGLLFSGWLIFFVVQTALVASGRVGHHRELGLLGIAVATAMFFVGSGVAINRIHQMDAAGLGDIGRRFSIVPFSGITLFLALFAIAIRNIRRPAVHKRLMLVATVSLLQAAVGRWTRLLLAPSAPETVIGSLPVPPPVAVTIIPGLVSDLLIVAAMIHDKRTHGRVHPVYWIAGGVLLAVQVLRVPLSATDAWMRLTYAISALAP